MGAKQSSTKKEVPTSRGRLHQYEEIDDDVLIDNQEKLKGNMLDCKSMEDGQTLTVPINDHQVLQDQARNTLDVPVSSAATLAQVLPTDSPRINKRYHPYDEVSDDKFVSNQKPVVDINKDIKEKKKDSPKEKFGGKKKKETKEKDAKKDSELVMYQSISEDMSLQTTPSQCSDTNSSDHVYSNIKEHQSASSPDVKKENLEGKSKKKDVLKVKAGKKKQAVASTVDEKIPDDNAPRQRNPVYQPKAGPLSHTYTEITEEQLVSNRNAHKLNKDEKYQNKEHDKVKDKKKKLKVTTGSETGINQNASTAESKLTTGTESPKLNSRHHPYDEISEETLSSNRKAILNKVGHNETGRCLVQERNNKYDETVDSEHAEYLNVAAITASSSSSLGSHAGHKEEEYLTEKDDIAEMYAVPHKKQPKTGPSKTLNYIQVEFNQTDSKAKIKQPTSPTNYCRVMTKDGRVILSES